MKNIKYLFLLIGILMVFSCKKNSNDHSGIASVNITNAVMDAPALYVYFTLTGADYYLQQTPVWYASGQAYGRPSGSSPVSIISSSDTSKPLFQTNLNIKAGAIYSLFVSGESGKIDTLFIQDTIPFRTDSSAGLRVINLSPGSQPVTVNLVDSPEHLEFPPLGYRQISDFKSYPGNAGITSYNFEIRDQLSGNVLTTFSWYFTLFKNYTLVIAGSEDPSSSSPLTVFLVNNF